MLRREGAQLAHISLGASEIVLLEIGFDCRDQVADLL